MSYYSKIDLALVHKNTDLRMLISLKKHVKRGINREIDSLALASDKFD